MIPQQPTHVLEQHYTCVPKEPTENKQHPATKAVVLWNLKGSFAALCSNSLTIRSSFKMPVASFLTKFHNLGIENICMNLHNTCNSLTKIKIANFWHLFHLKNSFLVLHNLQCVQTPKHKENMTHNHGSHYYLLFSKKSCCRTLFQFILSITTIEFAGRETMVTN